MCSGPAATSSRSPGLAPVLCSSSSAAETDSSFFRGDFSVPSGLTNTMLTSLSQSIHTIKVLQNNSAQNSLLQSPQLLVKSLCLCCVTEMLVPLSRTFDMVACGSDIGLYFAYHLHVQDDWWRTHGSKDCNISLVHFSPDRNISVTTGWMATKFYTDMNYSLKMYLVMSCATISFTFVFWAKMLQQLLDGLLLYLAQVPLLSP